MHAATNLPKTSRARTFFVIPGWCYGRIAVSNPRSAILIALPVGEDHRDSMALEGVPSANIDSGSKAS